MIVLCALIALVAARKPVSHFLGHLFHRDSAPVKQGPTFPLSLSVPRLEVSRFDLVSVEVTDVRADGTPVADVAPEVVVRDGQGDVVETVGEVKKVPLRFDQARGVWVGQWPVPFGAAAGPEVPYVLEARATFDPRGWKWETPEARGHRNRANHRRPKEQPEPKPTGQATCVASVTFHILRAPPPTLPPGHCVVTWEPNFPLTDSLTGPDGKPGDWKVMLDWAEFMGADVFWFRGGVTEAYGPKSALTDAQPWVPVNLEHIPELIQETHRRGLKFGAWAAAYETYPNRPSQHARYREYLPPYRWTQNFSRSQRAPQERAAISLLDTKRPHHLAQFCQQMQTQGADFVGFDYIRSGADWGGYELAEPFARDMPAVLPPNWNAMSQNDHMGWICDRLEGGRWQANIDLYHQWNWWRAHKLSMILQQIIKEANLQIPLWTFTLSWWHGEQHGQDPMMLADAGVGINAVMLYECDSVAQYDQLVEKWEQDIPPNQIYTLGGDQVSWFSHQKLSRPAAPEEFYRRITTAAARLTKGGPLQGAFVHDLSRICLPTLRRNRGPGYTGREWALAGAAAFSFVRNLWQVYPIECQLSGAQTVSFGSTFTCQLRIKNRSQAEVQNLDVRVLVDGTSVNCVGKKQQAVARLKPGEEINVPVEVQIVRPDGDRANRFMVAAQVRWPQADYGKSIRTDLPRLYTVMTYVNAG